MELAPPAETTPHLFESQSLASSIFLDHPNPLQAFPTNSSSFATGKDVVPDPLAAAQQDHLPFYSSVATALAGVFAISVNKICKIMEIFE